MSPYQRKSIDTHLAVSDPSATTTATTAAAAAATAAAVRSAVRPHWLSHHATPRRHPHSHALPLPHSVLAHAVRRRTHPLLLRHAAPLPSSSLTTSSCAPVAGHRHARTTHHAAHHVGHGAPPTSAAASAWPARTTTLADGLLSIPSCEIEGTEA
jgi:hypothetical protein